MSDTERPLLCYLCRTAGRDASKVRAIDLGNERTIDGVAKNTVAVLCETCDHAWNSTHPAAKELRKQRPVPAILPVAANPET